MGGQHINKNNWQHIKSTLYELNKKIKKVKVTTWGKSSMGITIYSSTCFVLKYCRT